MCATTKWRAVVAGLVLTQLASVAPATGQYAERPQVLAAVDWLRSATQIGSRLFVAGEFGDISPPTGGAVMVDATGAFIPGGFPFFDGGVHAIVGDGHGGWVVVGGFRQVDGEPFASFVRIRPDRTLDSRYRLTVDGPIRRVAIAHGRVYLLGDFAEVNGARRLGLAALDAATGRLSPWGSDFEPGIDPFTGRRRTLRNLSVSSSGVYVSGGGSELGYPQNAAAGRLWGFDAATGRRLFERTAFVTAIAATSTRIFVGGWRQPLVWAVDPRTGVDLPWTIGLTFFNLGSAELRVASLLLDADRLYLGGYFRTGDNQFFLAAVNAATGQPSTWRAGDALGPDGEVFDLTRIGSGIVALQTNRLSAFDVVSGARLPWNPQTHGLIASVAAAPDGAVLGGSFDELTGVARPGGLASFDLATGRLEPWTSLLPTSATVLDLETDGTYLFAATNSAEFFKIDSASGAVLGSVGFGGVPYLVAQRVAGNRLVAVVAGQIGVIDIDDWSLRTYPLALDGIPADVVHDLEVVGDTAYVAGRFLTANGAARPFLAALDLTTGAVRPFDASPDAEVDSVRFANGRLWVAGRFRRIGGARRRGLADLDPVTGRALAWNPDAPGGAWLDLGRDGSLIVQPSSTVGGRSRGRLTAFSTATGAWLPWRPATGDLPLFAEGSPAPQRRPALLPDCMVPTETSTLACYAAALPAPVVPTLAAAGTAVTLGWTLPAGPITWTGVQVEVGSREGASDLAMFVLPADATELAGPVPPGSYVARVRTTRPSAASLPTPDVSFAVGPPQVPAAPLDVTMTSEGTRLTFQWRPPTSGPPPGYVLEAETIGGQNPVALPIGGAATIFAIDAPTGHYRGRLRAMNADGGGAASGELLIDVDATESPCYDMPPQPPENLTAAVAGSVVTLSWSQPDSGPVASVQRVAVGSAPGLDDLVVLDLSGPATVYTTAAPRGRYFVRVTALNRCGASAPGNEVQVVVE